jgi:hypothetical protein
MFVAEMFLCLVKSLAPSCGLDVATAQFGEDFNGNTMVLGCFISLIH